MINFNFAYKLKLNSKQIQQIEHYLVVNRKVYNFSLREIKDWLNARKCSRNHCSLQKEYIIPSDTPFPSYAQQCKGLTEAKKTIPELKTVHSQVLQQTIKRLHNAFNDMRENGKNFPRFKKRLKSFVFPSMPKQCLGKGAIKVPALGWLKIRQSRDYPTGFEAKQARIVSKASGYYIIISFQSAETVPEPVVGITSMGIDVGIKSFIATNTGEIIKAPRLLKNNLRKLKLLQRKLKRKVKGSKLWLKLNQKIGKLHEKIANSRKDWHFKLAHYLCAQADNIFVEDINFVSWSKGSFRKVSLDYGIGSFINQVLPFVCWKRGKFYLKVNKDYTSQECPQCLRRTGKKSLSDRIHVCPHCEHREDRDVASAQVILNRGLKAVGHTVNHKTANGDGLAGVKFKTSSSQESKKLESHRL